MKELLLAGAFVITFAFFGILGLIDDNIAKQNAEPTTQVSTEKAYDECVEQEDGAEQWKD